MLSEHQVNAVQIDKEPHLETLRDQVNELKRLVDGEPNEQTITYTWNAFGKIKDALGSLAPNHPFIMHCR
jgi:hypothetical protein